MSELNLEELLNDMPGTIDQGAVPKINNVSNIEALDYKNIIKTSDKEAKSIVKQSILFFFKAEEIEREPYIFEKMKIDIITISNLLFQMKSSEHTIIRLIELIDEGSGNVRQFEVLSRLQTSKMEIVKHLQTVVTLMEKNYRDLRDYYKIKETDGRVEGIEEKKDKNTIRLSGGKSLMQNLQKMVYETDELEYRESK